MRPRISQGAPVGQTKDKRKKTKNPRRPIPAVLQLCECADCVDYPDSIPGTVGLPTTGRYLTKSEHKRHAAKERKRAAARLQHGIAAHSYPPPLSSPFTHSNANNGARDAPSPTPPPLFYAPSPRESSLEEQIDMHSRAVRSAKQVMADQMLIFRTPPRPSTVVDISLLAAQEIQDLCALDTSAFCNSAVLDYQERLAQVASFLENLNDNQTKTRQKLQIVLLQRRVELEKPVLESLLLQEWKRQEAVLQSATAFDTTKYFVRSYLALPPIALASFMLVATLHLLSGLSMDDCKFTLGVLHLVLEMALASSRDAYAHNTLRSIPRDVRTVVDILGINPYTKAYVCCPTCSSIYWVDPDNKLSYPETCTQQGLGYSPCGARLRKVKKRKERYSEFPRSEFHYQSAFEYVARLKSRPDLQEYLEGDPTTTNTRSKGAYWDIWDAPALQNFRGPDGCTAFVKGPPDEGRLIFSLNMDGFNPYGNREAGKKVSVGAIYMICLNLPPSLRYKPENVYLVGVIPGPREPSGHEINHLLKP
ncbi:hypothetical protein NLJ89_g6754 [Agrocybe chaxingu]|uniref:Uncharacterized protein n=1 Tax=Agrocybe chaxingu TaxID=84603 RepID=A0A9W8K5T7_9AGAR|nr:hypothetical protein NLJ89_g6754 [Agrocybe chaxingu]